MSEWVTVSDKKLNWEHLCFTNTSLFYILMMDLFPPGIFKENKMLKHYNMQTVAQEAVGDNT
jgi:hypothetical protein